MRHQIRQFASVAGLAALETLRQPVFLLAATTCLAMIALLPVAITHTLGEAEKMVRDSALALQFVFGLVLGAYAACASLTHEIRRGTAATVLTKPISRSLFFLAKFTGILLIIAGFSATAIMATLLSVRTTLAHYGFDWWGAGPLLAAILLAHLLAGIRNFFSQRPFVSSASVLLAAAVTTAFVLSGLHAPAGAPEAFGAAFSWPIVPAGVLVAMAVSVLTALAMTLAIRLDIVPTLSICSFVFMAGLVSDYVFGRHAADHNLALVLHRILPNWQHFWMADALSGRGTIPWTYVAAASGYALLYLAGVLCLGMLVFRNTEVRA